MAEFSEYELEALRLAAVQEPDWFLRDLVSMANDSDINVPVILTVGGSLVSGHIISGREYFRTFGQQLGIALGMTGERGAELFQPLIDAYYARPAEAENRAERAAGAEAVEEDSPEEREEEATPPPTYIHLKNARVYHGQSQIPQRFEGILWRGRLSMVGGFTVGEVRQERA